MTTSAINPFDTVNASSSSLDTSTTQNEAGSADRFLKLLVAQMQNQDPLNPMDNAQVTSQMAQINTVTGIQTLNTTVQSLNTQMFQIQALQGASLVGRDVTVPGQGLAIEDGVGVGGFDLADAADQVKVEILDTSGRVVDTLQLGAATAGVQAFNWSAGSVADGSAYSFRVTASAGAKAVEATSLMRDRVAAVSSSGNTLNLELARSGSVAYGDVRAFN